MNLEKLLNRVVTVTTLLVFLLAGWVVGYIVQMLVTGSFLTTLVGLGTASLVVIMYGASEEIIKGKS